MEKRVGALRGLHGKDSTHRHKIVSGPQSWIVFAIWARGVQLQYHEGSGKIEGIRPGMSRGLIRRVRENFKKRKEIF